MAPLKAARLAGLLQKIYPKQLAGSWDNTGLLLESPFTRASSRGDHSPTTILVCIDLTTRVCDEAISMDGCAHIVSYHPVIFSGLKQLTWANSQQRSLLRLTAAGISVYCPHTSIDAIHGGVNEMLVGCFESVAKVQESKCIEPCANIPEGFAGAGIGRQVILTQEACLEDMVSAIKRGLNLSHVQLARAPKPRRAGGRIRTIGLCAGSGGSVLKGAEVDLILTGELSHHEQLAFVEQGTHIILCGHANTERPYLPTMREQIQSLLDLEQEDVKVVVSEEDINPFETV